MIEPLTAETAGLMRITDLIAKLPKHQQVHPTTIRHWCVNGIYSRKKRLCLMPSIKLTKGLYSTLPAYRQFIRELNDE